MPQIRGNAEFVKQGYKVKCDKTVNGCNPATCKTKSVLCEVMQEFDGKITHGKTGKKLFIEHKSYKDPGSFNSAEFRRATEEKAKIARNHDAELVISSAVPFSKETKKWMQKNGIR